MKRVVFVQNIISPYRCHFFNSLYKKTSNFEVLYMSKSEKDRNWDYKKQKTEHPYWLDKWGLYFMLKGFHIHINPVLVFKTAFTRFTDAILAVSYCDINILVLALLKHLHLTKVRYHFWAEANYLTLGARKDSKLKRWVRRFVYSTCDGYFFVPGKMSVLTFEKWGYNNNKYIYLPNTIDEGNLVYNPDRNNEGLPTFLMPVRLIENVKGILNFFNAIGLENIRKARFVVAGDGSDYKLYQQYVEENKLGDYIILKGFCESKEMNDLYNGSDAVVLPSFSDPSPLSLVEALRFRLPILCSSHCGNHYETVEEGVNGITFSPLDRDDIRNKFELFLSKKNDWKAMGEKGWEIYNKTFVADIITERISKFVNE